MNVCGLILPCRNIHTIKPVSILADTFLEWGAGLLRPWEQFRRDTVSLNLGATEGTDDSTSVSLHCLYIPDLPKTFSTANPVHSSRCSCYNITTKRLNCIQGRAIQQRLTAASNTYPLSVGFNQMRLRRYPGCYAIAVPNYLSAKHSGEEVLAHTPIVTL